MLGLKVAKVLQVFFVDIPFAILSNHLNVVEIKQNLGFVLENLVDINFTLILTPKKSKNFINDIRFIVFVYVTKSLSLIFANVWLIVFN